MNDVNDYDKMHSKHPHTPIIGSETSSSLSDRGEYANDATRGQ